MKKRKFTILPIVLFAAVIVAVAMFSKGCTEDPVVTNETKVRTLSVQATVEDDEGECVNPAPQATFELFEVQKETRTSLGEFVADKNGNASFKQEVPNVGINALVVAQFENKTLQSDVFLYCVDTTITFCFPYQEVFEGCCDDLTDRILDTKCFTDENGNQRIIVGEKAKDQTINIICNNCEDGEIFSVALPNMPEPFFLSSALINGEDIGYGGGNIEVAPGECLSIVIGMNTENTGEFNETIEIGIGCNGTNVTWTMDLCGEVVDIDCGCPYEAGKDTVRISYPDLVKIGESSDEEIKRLFTNNFECDLIVDSIFIMENRVLYPYGTEPGQHDFRITDPMVSQLPLTIASGDEFTIDYVFEPIELGMRRDTFQMKLSAMDEDCYITVIFSGEACDDLCPTINGQEWGRNEIVRNVNSLFQPDAQCIVVQGEIYAEMSFEILPAENSCIGGNFEIESQMTDEDGQSLNYFDYNPKNMILNENGQLILNVEFTPPTKEEFDILRPNSSTKEDSTFTVILTLSIDGCGTQSIRVNATIQNFPKLSEPLKLFAYNQRTNLKPTPDYQVCKIYFWEGYEDPDFPNADVFSLRDNITKTGPWPLVIDTCQFYINVDDTTATDNPKDPELYLINGNNCANNIKLITRNYGEEDFDAVTPMLNFLKTEMTNAGNADDYFFNMGDNQKPYNYPNGIENIQIGDVYAIYSDDASETGIPCCLALIYITQVYVGTEDNTNKRSAIDFRVMSPVVP